MRPYTDLLVTTLTPAIGFFQPVAGFFGVQGPCSAGMWGVLPRGLSGAFNGASVPLRLNLRVGVWTEGAEITLTASD